MKKIFFVIGISVLVRLVVFQLSCSKDMTGRTDNTPALNPSNIDLDAGTWKPYY